jgi:hypothetical protein
LAALVLNRKKCGGSSPSSVGMRVYSSQRYRVRTARETRKYQHRYYEGNGLLITIRDRGKERRS